MLFGVATEKDIYEANGKIGHIENNMKKLIQSFNDEITILHAYSAEVESLEKSVEHLGQLEKNIQKETQKTRIEIGLNWMLTTLNKLHADLNTLDIGIGKMKAGKVAPEIISNKGLNLILNKLKANGANLLFENNDFILKYADLSNVILVPTTSPKALRFAIVIPLKEVQLPFHLYELIPMAQWNPKLEVGILYQPNTKYLAVSEDMVAFVPIYDLEQCKTEGKNYLCPAGQPIYLRESHICEIDLYLHGQQLVQTCPRIIFNQDKPSFYRIQDGYKFSVPEPMTLTIQCAHRPSTLHTKEIHGIGLLSLPSGCQATSEGIVLVTPKTETNSGKPIQVRVIQEMGGELLTEEEMDSLEEQKELLHQIIQRNPHTKHKISTLLQHLQKLKYEEYQQKWTLAHKATSLTFGSLVIMIIITIPCCLCFRKCLICKQLWNRCCEQCRKRRSATSPINNRNETSQVGYNATSESINALSPPTPTLSTTGNNSRFRVASVSETNSPKNSRITRSAKQTQGTTPSGDFGTYRGKVCCR